MERRFSQATTKIITLPLGISADPTKALFNIRDFELKGLMGLISPATTTKGDYNKKERWLNRNDAYGKEMTAAK